MSKSRMAWLLVVVAAASAFTFGCSTQRTPSPKDNSVQVKGRASNTADALQQIKMISDEAAKTDLKK